MNMSYLQTDIQRFDSNQGINLGFAHCSIPINYLEEFSNLLSNNLKLFGKSKVILSVKKIRKYLLLLTSIQSLF